MLVGIFFTALSQFVLAYLTLSIQAIYPVWSAPFWPASGAALAACILRGPWMLVGVYLGLALPNMTLWSTTPSWIAFFLPIGNVMETGLAWLILQRGIRNFDFRFTKMRDVGLFLALGPWIPAILSASFVQTCLLVAHIVPPERFAGETLVFWLGNATGIMLLTPVILVWRDVLQYQWNGPKGRRLLFLLVTVSLALSVFHAGHLPNYIRMSSVLIVPLVVWGIWSTGFRGAALICLLTSFVYFVFDIPESRPLSTLLNERHLRANISFVSSLKVDSPLNRNLPPPTMLEEALEQIGILTTLCLTLLPLGAASDELRRRGEQEDLVMQALDSTFWTWTKKDGVHFFNPKVAANLRKPFLLFEAHLPCGKLNVLSQDPQHPGYLSHWAVTDRGLHHEPLGVTGILQSRAELTKRQAAEAKAEIASLEMQALRAHLNPHLIFNCLTGLRGMIKSKPDLARDFTSRLARFLRAVVDSQASTLITVQHEIEICDDYVRLENLRGKNIQWHHHPHPLEAKFFVPPLSVVTLVENAVKHGSANAEGHVAIQVQCLPGERDSIQLSVRQPGKVRDLGKGNTPGGLSLLRQQLDIAFQHRANLSLSELPDGQVEACMTLPQGLAA